MILSTCHVVSKLCSIRVTRAPPHRHTRASSPNHPILNITVATAIVTIKALDSLMPALNNAYSNMLLFDGRCLITLGVAREKIA
mmetsp:Transcript_20436/g.28510  ORF Transcript_20436/g.28510 Transcript_20436/m.28510 type:complete len:84 (-) Transcript_20436:89-340(-)